MTISPTCAVSLTSQAWTHYFRRVRSHRGLNDATGHHDGWPKVAGGALAAPGSQHSRPRLWWRTDDDLSRPRVSAHRPGRIQPATRRSHNRRAHVETARHRSEEHTSEL